MEKVTHCPGCHCLTGCPTPTQPEPDDTDARALWEEAGKHWPGGATTWNESVYKPQYRALAAWCRRYFGGKPEPVDPDAGPRLLLRACKVLPGVIGGWDSLTGCSYSNDYRAMWAAARAYFQAHREELER